LVVIKRWLLLFQILLGTTKLHSPEEG